MNTGSKPQAALLLAHSTAPRASGPLRVKMKAKVVKKFVKPKCEKSNGIQGMDWSEEKINQ